LDESPLVPDADLPESFVVDLLPLAAAEESPEPEAVELDVPPVEVVVVYFPASLVVFELSSFVVVLLVPLVDEAGVLPELEVVLPLAGLFLSSPDVVEAALLLSPLVVVPVVDLEESPEPLVDAGLLESPEVVVVDDGVLVPEVLAEDEDEVPEVLED
jgi:hypothetical protein